MLCRTSERHLLSFLKEGNLKILRIVVWYDERRVLKGVWRVHCKIEPCSAFNLHTKLNRTFGSEDVSTALNAGKCF